MASPIIYRYRYHILAIVGGAGLLLLLSLVKFDDRDEVVVYASLDREFSEPILNDFQRQTKLKPLVKYDVESSKTLGFVTAILEERNSPRCDVFWNNEILHTFRLEKEGVLEAYLSPAAKPFPENYRSPEGTWHGLAARARVLIVNTKLVAEADRPTSVEDLADPRWKGKVAIAKPLFGTTATHAAVLFSRWGDERAKAFFRKLKTNAAVLSGNKQVAISVASGEFAFGITDTDDAVIEREKGADIAIIYPDQKEDQEGALFIPNTLCIIKNAPHPENARKLIDFLLTPQVETKLAQGASAQFPLNPNVDVTSKAMPRVKIKWMDVDFRKAADRWETASKFLRDEFDP